MTENGFLRISWPDRFTVNFTDGTSRTLARGEGGVAFSSAADDPSNRGSIVAVEIKRHPGGRERGLVSYFDEISSIVTETGNVLWTAPA